VDNSGLAREGLFFRGRASAAGLPAPQSYGYNHPAARHGNTATVWANKAWSFMLPVCAMPLFTLALHHGQSPFHHNGFSLPSQATRPLSRRLVICCAMVTALGRLSGMGYNTGIAIVWAC
jgi:hypothetical protein